MPKDPSPTALVTAIAIPIKVMAVETIYNGQVAAMAFVGQRAYCLVYPDCKARPVWLHEDEI